MLLFLISPILASFIVKAGTASSFSPVRILFLAGYTSEYLPGYRDYVKAWSDVSGIELSPHFGNGSGDMTVNEYSRELGLMTEQQRGFWDIVFVDVIWPANYTNLLLPLDDELTPGYVDGFDPGLIPAATVKNRLYALPNAGSKVGLYYRQDLLYKYNFTGPPKTWDEAERMIQTIIPAERAQGNSRLHGYIGQFAPYEGLTCNIMEFIGTLGGMIEPDGSLSIVKDPSKAAEILDMMRMLRRWIEVGHIPPVGLFATEGTAARMFQSGEVLFMRNWHVRSWLPVEGGGVGAIAPMPGRTMQEYGRATNGAIYLGVNRFTKNRTRTVEAFEYALSEGPLAWWTEQAAQIPTRSRQAADQNVCQLLESCPLTNLTTVSRPSAATGAKYPQVSAILFTNWHAMLAGKLSPEACLDKMKWELADLLNINLLGEPIIVEWNSPAGMCVLILVTLAQLYIVSTGYPLMHSAKWSREQRRASPRLILALLGGLALMNVWPLAYMGNPTVAACIARSVVPGITWTIALGVMAVQDLQVYLIMTSPLRMVAMDVNRRLRLFLVSSQLAQVTVSALFGAFVPPTPGIAAVGRQYQYASCRIKNGGGSEAVLATLFMTIMLLVFNTWLVLRLSVENNMKTVHRVPIVRVMYLILVLGLIVITADMVERLHPSARSLIMAAVALAQTIGVSRLYVQPRVSGPSSSASLGWMGQTQAGDSESRSTAATVRASISSKDVTLFRRSDLLTCRVASSLRTLELKPSVACSVVLMRDTATLIVIELNNRGQQVGAAAAAAGRFRRVIKLENQLVSTAVTKQQKGKGSAVVQSIRLALTGGRIVELTCSHSNSATVTKTIGQWNADLGELAQVQAVDPDMILSGPGPQQGTLKLHLGPKDASDIESVFL